MTDLVHWREKIRIKLDIKPGQMFRLTLEGDKAVITALLQYPIKALRGALKGKASMTKALLEDRKEERKRGNAIPGFRKVNPAGSPAFSPRLP